VLREIRERSGKSARLRLTHREACGAPLRRARP
jgi:hypothetical protein